MGTHRKIVRRPAVHPYLRRVHGECLANTLSNNSNQMIRALRDIKSKIKDMGAEETMVVGLDAAIRRISDVERWLKLQLARTEAEK